MLEEIKIRCDSCHKKFSGQRHQIAKLSKCPKCGAESDWWTEIASTNSTPVAGQLVKNENIENPTGAQRSADASNLSASGSQSATTGAKQVNPKLVVPSKVAVGNARVVPSQPVKRVLPPRTKLPGAVANRRSRFWIAALSGIGLLSVSACLILAGYVLFDR